jgi:hypothetical protein
MELQQGQFVEVRGRPWLVEAVDDREPSLTTLRLSCIADDAQGEQIEVLWDAEIGAKIIQDDTWSGILRAASLRRCCFFSFFSCPAISSCTASSRYCRALGVSAKS